MVDYLSEMTEEEFGSGNEIESTGFLIFGILTLWIYNVWKYHAILKKHLNHRLNHFQNSFQSISLSDKNKNSLRSIIDNGFRIKPYPKYISIFFYCLCLSILILEIIFQQLLGRNLIGIDFFDSFIIIGTGLAALLFCFSTIFFLSWVCRTVRNHEYNELLMLRMIEDPQGFKMLQPSLMFLRRWNKNQNTIAFFLIIAFPIILTPFISVKYVYSIIERGGDFVLAIAVLSIFIFALGAVFHLWGTHLLLTMYNGHLRIETINMPGQESNIKITSIPSSTVLKDSKTEDIEGKTKDLLPERSLSAIMFTDMVGFSGEMERNENATYSKLMVHNNIIRKHIKKLKGQEIKTIGDAFLVRFNSAVDAVRAAIEIQNEFSDYNQEQDENKRICVRIGIHIGDILLMEGDVFGNGVNVAARIEPLAEPGGICLSADVYNVVKKSIDIKVMKIGKRELKNIKDAPEIYRILLRESGE